MSESANLARLRAQLLSIADPSDAQLAQRFFKTGPGQYGEGDRFLGITTPRIRQLVREHRGISPETATELVRSPWHEERLCGLLLWIETWKATRKPRLPQEEARETRRRITALLLSNLACVNNWDLVDTAIPTLLGEALLEDPDPAILERLVASEILWERRCAVLSTFAAIRAGRFEDTLRLCERLLEDPHDLMHKACGWMLRELGKRDAARLLAFLHTHYAALPRTTLRYAIEKFTPAQRAAVLKGDFANATAEQAGSADR